MKIWADNSSDAVLDYDIDLSQIILKDDNGLHQFYVGFTAATG